MRFRPGFFVKNIDFCDHCKIEVDYNTLKMLELKALVRERELWGHSRIRKDGLIAFLQDSVQMETNYDTLRLVELKALAREHGLQGYYRLKRAELIAFLWDNVRTKPAPSVRPRTKPMRPPLPPPEDSFAPYEVECAFGRVHRSSRSMEGVEWMWKPSLEEVLLT